MGIDIYLDRIFYGLTKEKPVPGMTCANLQSEEIGYFRGRRDMLKWWLARLGAESGEITAQDIAQYLMHVLTFPDDGVGYAPYDFLIPSDDCRHTEPCVTDHAAEVDNFLDPWRKALKCLHKGDKVMLRLSY